MDPITLILTALASGASMAAGGALGEAGKEAYDKIKKMLKSKFGKNKKSDLILSEFTDDPKTWEQPLAKALKQANAEADEKLLQLAKQIIKKAQQQNMIISIGPTAIGPQAKAAEVIIENYFEGDKYTGETAKDEIQTLKIYREQILHSCRHLMLRGISKESSDAQGEQKQMRLTEIYIHLDTKSQKQLGSKGKQERPEFEGQKDTKQISAMEAASKNRKLVILGDPGSGKSTFINFLAHGLAATGLQTPGADIDYFPGWQKEKKDLIPITIILRDFARQLLEHLPQAECQHLWDFVKSRLKATNLLQVEKPLRDALENGKAIVLLDGLDEIPTREQRTYIRDVVNKFSERYLKNRYIITCRKLSYENKNWQLEGFPTFELAPFNEKQINNFIEAWYNELVFLQTVKSKDEGNTLAGKLKEAVRKPDMWQLAPNPLLLTVMALVHTHTGRLPEARALLYEETVEILLWRWEEIKVGGLNEKPKLRQLLLSAGRSEVDLKKVLWKLAFEAHALGGTETAEKDKLADIHERSLQKEFAAWKKNDRNWAWDIIETIKLRAGLLIERADGIFTFPHRTFQEYLAGAYLSSQANFAKRATKLLTEENLWREVVLLAVGRLVYLVGDNEKPLMLVSELLNQQNEKTDFNWRNAWFAGDVLLEMQLSRVQDSNTGKNLLPQVREKIADLVSGGALSPVERAAAGRTLAKLGDPRPGVAVITKNNFPEILWCHVPEGKFWMGSDKSQDSEAYDDELEQHEVFLKEFYISRYPVTNAQYYIFVKDGGYKKEKFWREAIKENFWKNGKFQEQQEPRDFGEVYSLSNHPVVGISWYEALAFCHWLHEKVKNSNKEFNIKIWQKNDFINKQLSSNKWQIILPSEAEWEKAARGDDKRIYPWGDKIETNFANYGDTGINSTSAIGCFPKGQSPYGLLDMGGNVWEWTRSIFKDYPYKQNDGREKLNAGKDKVRVLRGAVRSTILRGTCAVPVASGTIRMTGTTVLDFV